MKLLFEKSVHMYASEHGVIKLCLLLIGSAKAIVPSWCVYLRPTLKLRFFSKRVYAYLHRLRTVSVIEACCQDQQH